MGCLCSWQVCDGERLLCVLESTPRGATGRCLSAWCMSAVTITAVPKTDEAVLPQMLQEAGPPQDSSQRLSHALSTFERAAAQVCTLEAIPGGMPGTWNLDCCQCASQQVR